MMTKKCNLKCDFCKVKHNLNTPEKDHLSLDEWHRIIDSIPRTAIIDLCGGEIFFAPNMLKILDYMFKKNRVVSLITNGTTITEKHIDFFIDGGLTYFLLSLDGMSKSHNRIRGKRGAFERADKMLRYLSSQKRKKGKTFPLVCIKTVITGDNEQDIPKLLDYAENEINADHIQIALIHNTKLQLSFDHFDSFCDPLLKEGNGFAYPEEKRAGVKRTLNYILNYKKRSKMYVGISPEMKRAKDILDFVDNPKSFNTRNCNRPWSEIFMNYDGSVTSCIAYQVGNIRDANYDIGKVTTLPRYRDFLKYYKKELPFLPICEGCCRPLHEKVNFCG